MKDAKPISSEEYGQFLAYLLGLDQSSELRDLILKVENLLEEGAIHETRSEEAEAGQQTAIEVDLELGEKAVIAQEAYNLIAPHLASYGNGLLVVPTLSGTLDISFDLKKVTEAEIQDKVKLVDMLSTTNLPSQVEAHYREVGQPSSIEMLRKGELTLSDGEACLELDRDKGEWSLRNGFESFAEEIGTALTQLNSEFAMAREYSTHHEASLDQAPFLS